MKKNINGYLIVYLVLLTFFSVFFLYQKHDVGNDSTIAEWLINYSGGFTKRGLLGEISIFFATLFSYELRDVIFNFQIFTVVTYFAFIYLVLKNIEFERLLLLSIFTPIFILYPVAEIEVLARKELFIFIFYILYFFVPKNKIKLHNLFKLIVLPISVLIWEPVVFFLSFWLAIDLIRNESKKIDLHFFLNLTTYIPTIILALYIAFNPLTSDAHLKMTEFLKYNFNEHCYGACTLLLGKSTIIDIVMGLIKPNEGKVLVDNANIHLNIKGWQKRIGYVSQSIYLIDDTIKNNIAFGIEPHKIDNNIIEKVSKDAQILDFIKSLKNGFETKVGERGIKLSGGQIQRIGIARELYLQPELLIFDEATSALDKETELEFLNCLESLKNRKTIIFVSHRKSALKNCNKITEID